MRVSRTRKKDELTSRGDDRQLLPYVDNALPWLGRGAKVVAAQSALAVANRLYTAYNGVDSFATGMLSPNRFDREAAWHNVRNLPTDVFLGGVGATDDVKAV